jgi:plasmid stabilization system protein ParE
VNRASKWAERVETAIRDKIVLLARMPAAGHLRKDLTGAAVKFFPVYSYLIVYGRRDVAKILKERL